MCLFYVVASSTIKLTNVYMNLCPLFEFITYYMERYNACVLFSSDCPHIGLGT